MRDMYPRTRQQRVENALGHLAWQRALQAIDEAEAPKHQTRSTLCSGPMFRGTTEVSGRVLH